jgi:CubicO group peptidase (beta-lactamase class C family)
MKAIGIIVIVLALAATPAMVASDVGTPDDKPRSQPMLNYTAKRITTPDWDQPENRHFTYSNFDKVHPYPTIISRGTGPVHDLPVIEDGGKYLQSFRIKPWKQAEEMNLQRLMYELRTDALVIMKDGKIVYEAYPRQLRIDQSHTLMSSSKTLTAMILSRLIEEGKITLETEVKSVIPELGTAFDGVTLHQALNMDVVMNFSEDYTDPSSEGNRIFVAECWGEGCEKDRRGARGFLTELTSDDPHNNPDNVTHYNSAVTSVLGWIIERLTGMNFNYAVSFYLYKHVGAGHNAIGLNDQTGFGHGSGYVAFTARDAARLHSAIANDGVAANGVRILPKGYFAKTVYGDSKATLYPYGTRSSWKYSHQLVFNGKGGMAHMGYGGQLWYANKDTGVTIIHMASIDAEGAAVTLNSANALLDMADIINELLKDKKF